jgi:hypothetical protein
VPRQQAIASKANKVFFMDGLVKRSKIVKIRANKKRPDMGPPFDV